jgi:MFS family permease
VWAIAVAVVLADSSIVTLALPDILAEYDASVIGVSWVLIAFNLVLAVAVLPASRLARKSAKPTWVVGVLAFGFASLACALAGSIGALIVARCAQALGGAAVIAAAIELLAGSRGSHERAASTWGSAGLVGLAVGPALGGLLTQALSWESIFVVQVPIVLTAAAVRGRRWAPAVEGAAGRIDARPEVALALLSAALTGALFLLVIMLTQGWLLSPLEAALVVSAMPAATLLAVSLGRGLGTDTPALVGGAVFVAGGLAGLGLVPGASWPWTLAPQLMIGVGLAVSIPGLTRWALATGDPAGHRAVSTIAARHAGVVAGLLLLTPIFSAQLEDANEKGQLAGTALVLDATLAAETKLELSSAISRQIDAADGRLPELEPAFDQVQPADDETAEYASLSVSMQEELEKAATSAFSLAFIVASALALASAVPIFLGGRR